MIKNNIIKKEWILFLMILTSSMFVLQVKGMSFFLLLQVLFCVYMFIKTKDILLCPFPMVNFIFIELGITAVSALVGNMRFSYKKSAIIMTIMAIPLYFTITYLYRKIKNDKNIVKLIIKMFKIMCIIQLLWLPLQYILYHKFGVDINRVIFVDTLHLLENASFYRSFVYHPSGLTWHSAVLAPMFVLAFVLFKNTFIRLLIIMDVMICGNSTSMIGVFVCAVMLFVFWIIYNQRSLKIKRIMLITIILVIFVVVALLCTTDIGKTLGNSITYLWNRLFGEGTDASTEAHFGYYADYLKIIKNSSLFQILFGYGYGCSGYPITMMYDRYIELDCWAIECDIINILVSRGIIGFIGYYGFLIYNAIKGFKIDYRYFIVMFTILIQGIGYNIQWDYVFLMEVLMFFTIKLGFNFFEHVDIFEKGKLRVLKL